MSTLAPAPAVPVDPTFRHGVMWSELVPVVPAPVALPDVEPELPPAPDPVLPGVPLGPGAATTYALLAVDQLTHRRLAVFPSAAFGDVDRAVWGVDPTSADATVSAGDAGWRALGAPTRSVRGELQVDWRGVLARVLWQVWERTAAGRSSCIFEGRAAGPVQSGDRVALSLAGGGSLLAGRHVGHGGTRDLLAPHGTFDGGSAGAGWSVPGGVSFRFGGYASFQSLLIGPGETRSPWSKPLLVGDIPSVPGFKQARRATVMVDVKTLAGGVLGVSIEAQEIGGAHRSLSGSQSVVSEDDTAVQGRWVQGDAVLYVPPGTWRLRVVLAALVPAGITPAVDLIRLVASDEFGDHTPRPLSQYPGMVMQAAQTAESGGLLGVGVKVVRSTPAYVRPEAMVWQMNDDPSLVDVLETISERVGGPDLWIEPGGVLMVDGVRRGARRDGLVLTDDIVVAREVVTDPSRVIAELRVGIAGSGAARQVIGVDHAVPAGAVARRGFTSAPSELNYRQAMLWAAGQGAAEFADGLVVDVTVPLWWGRMVNGGDTLRVAVADGLLSTWEWVRVYAMVQKVRDEHMVLRCGINGGA